MKVEVSKDIADRLKAEGIESLTEIQEMAIPAIREGRDVVIKSETGSGKTFAFLIPVAEMLRNSTEKANLCLILAPTRELAKQIFREFKKISKDYAAIVYGGVPMDRQIDQLSRSRIVIGTPGRILDLMSRGYIDLSSVKMVVLDEFDKMLEMGFKEDVDKILNQTSNPQRIYVSATIKHEVESAIGSARRVESSMHNVKENLKHYYVDCGERGKLRKMISYLQKSREKVLIFTSTKSASRFIAEKLRQRGMKAESINGDMPQKARERTLERYRSGDISIIVATDVVARGIHVEDIDTVINYDAPRDVELYIHRSGRTARQGRKGKCITFIESRDYRSFQRIAERFREMERLKL